jgi:prepilin-type N-terminal cleavage/methylation domain-containing protein
VTRLRGHGFWENERGFTLPEVLIVIAIMGILAAIAIPMWWNVVEGRNVDSAANQLVSDLRLAHTRATNQLSDWQVVLTSGGPAYQVGPASALRTRTLPDSTEVFLTSGGTLTIVFKPEGSAEPTGSSITFRVRSATDGNPYHEIEINTQTSRIKVD